jgi:hypothetical protein
MALNGCVVRAMMEVLMPNNYDRTTHLYWFRKLERHPDEGVQALAEGFCERVSSWLGMRPGCVLSPGP